MAQNRKKSRQKRKRCWRAMARPGADNEYSYHTNNGQQVIHYYNHQALMVFQPRAKAKRVYRGWGAPDFTLGQTYAEYVVRDTKQRAEMARVSSKIEREG